MRLSLFHSVLMSDASQREPFDDLRRCIRSPEEFCSVSEELFIGAQHLMNECQGDKQLYQQRLLDECTKDIRVWTETRAPNDSRRDGGAGQPYLLHVAEAMEMENAELDELFRERR